MAQWLGLSASTEGDPDSIPGQETKILQATGRGQKKKKSVHTSHVISWYVFCFLIQEHLDNDDSHNTTTGIMSTF